MAFAIRRVTLLRVSHISTSFTLLRRRRKHWDNILRFAITFVEQSHTGELLAEGACFAPKSIGTRNPTHTSAL